MSVLAVESSLTSPDEAQRASSGPGATAPSVDAVNLTQVFTLVVWLMCLGVGVVGLRLRYGAPVAPPAPLPPVQAQMLTVEVTKDPMPAEPLAAPPAPDVSEPPPPAPEDLAAPAEPPLAAVAEPAPAIAFAAPVEGPAKVVEPRQAVPAHITPPAPAHVSPGVQHLTFGQGEGRQPAPEYPSEAIAAQEEGAVLVRFNVGESGRVLSAQVVNPSRWPVLNQAALRTVRDRWQFPFGPSRTYDVVIRFKLNEQ